MKQFIVLNMMRIASVLCVVVLSLIGAVYGQTSSTSTPKIIEKNGRHALLVDGMPFLILGGQAHNSSAWTGMLPNVWQAIDAMHANTLEAPIYWEQIEAQPGKFDFSLVNTLLVQARNILTSLGKKGNRLILLHRILKQRWKPMQKRLLK